MGPPSYMRSVVDRNVVMRRIRVKFHSQSRRICYLTPILLTWRIGWAPNNASNWQMGFNSTFKGLIWHSRGSVLVLNICWLYLLQRGSGVAWWLRHCATSRTVPGSIPGGVTWDFFRGSFGQNHVPWGRLSPWKWVPGISPGVKAAGAYGWRPTTLVVPNVTKIRGLHRPGTPWAC
jgi:hypothetical protein